MRILVVGAGATGGYFGGRLLEAGRDVTFLVRPARAADLNRNGLRLKSPLGDRTWRPKLVTVSDIESSYDLILVAVKSYSLERALMDLVPAVGPRTMIVPVMNGMRHLDLIKQRFSSGVLGGVCFVAASLDDEGAIKQLNEMNEVSYGELDGTISPRLRQLNGVMQGATFDAKMSSAIVQDMWEKWISLASLGGLTCLFRGTIGQIEAVPYGGHVAHRFLDEAISVADAAGHRPSDAFRQRMRTVLTTPKSPLASSMYRDLTQGRSVEVAFVMDDLRQRAHSHGIDVPLIEAAVMHLQVYQDGLASGS